MESLRSAAGRIVEWYDARLNPRMRHLRAPADSSPRSAALALLDLIDAPLVGRLATESPDDADEWVRAIVEEHCCELPSAARYAVYESLLGAVSAARRSG
jgi:hypothetical protein